MAAGPHGSEPASKNARSVQGNAAPGAGRTGPSGDVDARAARGLRRFEAMARLEIAVASLLALATLRLLRATVTVEIHGGAELESCWKSDQRVLMVFWHGRSIMVPFFYAGPGVSIMNSTHRDGEIITRVLAHFGIESVRGSSSRGAVVGALGLLRAFRRGRDLALVPDGPRGPAGVAKAGVAELALQTRAPVFPVAVSCSRAFRLHTWDRMMLPRPGARVVFVVGDPVRPLPERSGGGRSALERGRLREGLRAELELRLRRVTAAADRLAGREVVEEA